MTSPNRVIPSLETLEARSLPAALAPVALADGVAAGANTLRNAILAANADATAEDFTITLRAGTYALTRRNNFAEGQENAAATGDLDVTTTDHKVVISGQVARGRRLTVIDATALRDRVFHLLGAGVRIELRDLVLRGGLARDDGTAGARPGNGDARGGGVLNNGGSLTLVNVLVTGNRAVGADAQGGGICSTGGTIVLDRNAAGASALTKNLASGGNGGRGSDGAMGQGGGLYASDGTVTLNAANLTGNIARGGRGGNGIAGGISSLSSGGSGGAGGVGEGGGLYASGAAISLTLTTFSGNRATGGAGGIGSNGKPSRPSSGTPLSYGGYGGGGTGGSGGAGGSGAGGGLYSGGGTVTLLNSTFGGNQATGGAGGTGGRGLGSQGSGGGSGTPLSYGGYGGGGTGGSGGAGGSGAGGGLYSGGGTVTLLNSTFSGNAAVKGTRGGGGGGPSPGVRGERGSSEGGGIAGTGITVRNTISARNTAEAGPDFSGAATAASGNLLGNGSEATGFDAANGNLVGTAAAPINPKLGKFGANGGPTATFALLAGSPALDAGDDAFSPGATDQRGAVRAVNGIDIGSFEFQSNLSLAVAVSAASVKAGGKIAYTLTVTNLGPDAASLVTLTSAVPAGATFVSLTVPLGWRKATPIPGGTGAITATLPALARGRRAVLTLVVRVGMAARPGDTIALAATLGPTALDPVAGNNSVNPSVSVVA